MNKLIIGNLDLYYGEFHALKSIHLEIPANEITAFIGPSGCSKSILLRSLNRMNDLVKDRRTTRKVPLDGEDIYCNLDINELRKKVGMVFQKPSPFLISIYGNIAFGPRIHGIHAKTELNEIAKRSLKQAAIRGEMKDRSSKSAMGLSGGQQQRLCIAHASVIEPDVLLMDEPTSVLDPISTSRIEDLVIELKEKYSIVVVAYNMQQAVRISDETAFFLMGEVVEFNKTSQLFSLPQDERTENYIIGRSG